MFISLIFMKIKFKKKKNFKLIFVNVNLNKLFAMNKRCLFDIIQLMFISVIFMKTNRRIQINRLIRINPN